MTSNHRLQFFYDLKFENISLSGIMNQSMKRIFKIRHFSKWMRKKLNEAVEDGSLQEIGHVN
jgi:hypothetical protein